MRRIKQKIAELPGTSGLIKFSIGLLACVVFISIIAATRTYRVKLNEGDIATASIYAPHDFSFEDAEATKTREQEVAAKVKDIYTIDLKVGEEVLKDIDQFYERISRSKLKKLEKDEATGLVVSNIRASLKTEKADTLRKKSKEIAASIMNEGFLDSSLKDELLKKETISIVIYNPLTEAEIETQTSQILTAEGIKRKIAELAQKILPYDRRLKREIQDLVRNFTRPNLFYDEPRTLASRRMVMKKIPPVLEKVKKGKLIVGKGEIITAEHITQLNALAELEVRQETLSSLSGIGLLVIIFVGLMGAYLYKYAPKIFASNQNLVLIAAAMFSSLALAKLMTFSQLPSHLVSIACVSMLICSPMLVAILLEPGVAVMVATVLAVFAGIMGAGTFAPVIVTLTGGLVGIYSVVGIRMRRQLMRAGVLVGVANFLCISAIGLLIKQDPRIFMTAGAWGLTGGIVASFVIWGLLPIFESLFKVTTDISLLELSDLNHPLLRRLIVEAPGTYHHSLIVGNLAEAAAKEVGANPLLARIASYYHDIGKIDKAEYFSENQPKSAEGKGKLDKLAPTMSSLIIINHVKKGVELARKYKLNRPIIDAIKEHHGASQVFFFYQRVLERIEDEEEIKRLEFRYPGPKPQTKESAIVLLADSIEAASRTLSEPTPASIKGMVRKIINNKFIDGQLEECELTLKNLNAIADSFVRILTGIFHARVEYPESKESRTPKTTRLYEDKGKKSTEGS